MRTMPANFNFVEFLVAATTIGATHIKIDDSRIKAKFSPEITSERIKSILIPACDLAGVSVSFGTDGKDICGYHISEVLRVYREYGHIKKLKSVLPHGTAKYTITIRDYERNKQRDSNRAAWDKFAQKIGAVVIDDWSIKPIGLHERMALYAGAKMNYHVTNGPASLCYFSDAPFTIFMKNVDADYHQRHGFPIGSQLPWQNENQKFIWADDTYESIENFAGCVG